MRGVCPPIADMVGRIPYAAIDSVHQDPTDPMPAWDGGILLRELTAETIDALLATAGPEVDVPLIIAEIRTLGGALAREAEPPNAVGGRDAPFPVCLIGPYPPPLRDAVVLAAKAPWSEGGMLVNFLGRASRSDQVRLSWPLPILERLRAVKRAWDPEGRFRFGYSLD